MRQVALLVSTVTLLKLEDRSDPKGNHTCPAFPLSCPYVRRKRNRLCVVRLEDDVGIGFVEGFIFSRRWLRILRRRRIDKNRSDGACGKDWDDGTVTGSGETN